MPYVFLQAEQSNEIDSEQIKPQEYLIECWGVDPHTTEFLCQYFKPLLKNKSPHHLITDLPQSLKEDSLIKNNNSSEENEIEIFEKKIAYFFGVDNEAPIIEAYMNALEKLKMMGSDPIELLEKEMIPHLEKAYQSIKQQRNWSFDPYLAAKIEFQIILGNFTGSSFEVVQDLMIQLYSTIFQSNSHFIQKAAMLRTFLYQYKASLLKIKPRLIEEDQRVMLEIAKTSKEFLNSIK